MTHVPETFFRGFHARPSLNGLARLFSLVVAAMITVLTPGISNAIIWNDVADFSSSNPSGAWRYGQGTTGFTFSPYTVFSTACNGQSGVSCWQPSVIAFGVPLVGKNTTGSTLNFGTVVLPTDVLWVHPQALDSIVQWTAPTAGVYNISGFFELLDVTPNGIFVGIYDNSASVFAGALTSPGATAPNTPGQKLPFSFPLSLAANDVISFGVNSGGNFFFDSTGLAATITSVPEPTSLSLLASGLAGFWWLRKALAKS
jgi:hypothetical protein